MVTKANTVCLRTGITRFTFYVEEWQSSSSPSVPLAIETEWVCTSRRWELFALGMSSLSHFLDVSIR